MPGRVFVLHGIVPNPDRGKFAFRNLLPTEALRIFISSSGPYVSLSDALAGRGTALTVDDATRAGADAALLIRSLGFPVTLFVNPGQVEASAPYHFIVLNALLDRLDGASYEFAGQQFETAFLRQRQELRLAIKQTLRAMVSEQQRFSFLVALAQRWNLGVVEVPRHFRTLDKVELRALLDAGVDLQNHGWSHTHHASLSPAESAKEVHMGREWIRKELGTDAPWFAVPFGDARPHDKTVDCDAWITANNEWPEGWIAPSVFNRPELLLPDPDGDSKSLSPLSLLRRLSGLLRP